MVGNVPMQFRPLQIMTSIGLLTCAGLAATFGYRLLRAEVVSEVYRDRLEALASDYAALQHTYNDVVRRTAVTELIVEHDRLDVRIRDAAGEIQRLETPFDPSGEIYVDYVILEGRLWIRRVFDADTPPSQGLIIDPEIACIDWKQPNASHGKAVYRALEPGRWVISVTGNGSLGLVAAPDGETALVHTPPLHDFGEMERQIEADTRGIGIADVWHSVTR